MLRALCALLLLPTLLCGQEIKGKTDYPAHALVRLQIVGVPEKTGFLWEVEPGVAVDQATTTADRLEFAAPPGAYHCKILLVTVGPDGVPVLRKLAVRITIGGTPPVPPVPPVPPDPVPPVPPVPPVDPLFDALQEQFKLEPSADKRKQTQALASVYRDGAKKLLDDPGNTRTAGQLYTYMRGISIERLPGDALKGIRGVTGKELNTVLPTDPDVSIAVDRTRIAASLIKLAGYLEALK